LLLASQGVCLWSSLKTANTTGRVCNTITGGRARGGGRDAAQGEADAIVEIFSRAKSVREYR
ncbi:MAG: hypothetical protein LBM60_09695, partial [Clostridium sp.]|nr:hypothetical protein [Clostridium sp.]